MRDTYRVMAPVSGPPIVVREAFLQTQDDIYVLYSTDKIHLDRKPASEPERAAAFPREYQRTMGSYEEMKGVYEAHKELFDATDDQEVLLRNLIFAQKLCLKLQALMYTTGDYYKLAINAESEP
jgi:hypothetical protein